MILSARTWARRSAELLDDPAADGGAVLASLGDIVRANRLFGGLRAALARLDEFFREATPARALSLLDVGTGLGDIPVAAAGIFLASFPLRFQPATQRDSVVSVFRGFTPRELEAICRSAGVAARVRRYAGFHLTAAWRKNRGHP